MIERKTPLGPAARRKGWVGCRILLQTIPQSGRISIVRDGLIELKAGVQRKWQSCLFLRQPNQNAKSWLVHAMHCIERIGKQRFSLDEVYAFENELKAAFPGNKHVKAKIRQKLQELRDNGYIDFIGHGVYRLSELRR